MEPSYFTDKPGLGVIVGRFQVPRLHDGHRFIVQHALQHQRSLIVVGVHPFLLNRDHPLDFAARKAMIQDAYPDVMVSPLMDCPTDEEWSERLDQLIQSVQPVGDVTIYGGRDSFIPYYHGRYKTQAIESVTDHSGTNERMKVAHVTRPTEDFRRGMIAAAHGRFPRVNMAVDITMLMPIDESQIRIVEPGTNNFAFLNGRRRSDNGKWRLIGGFVDVDDDSLESAAKRELREESGLIAEHPLYYVGSYHIDDWRNVKDMVTKSAFFVTGYFSGKAVAGDDIDEVRWTPLNKREIEYGNFVEAHKNMLFELCEWVERNRNVLT